MPTLQTEYITILEAFRKLFSKRIGRYGKILLLGAIVASAEQLLQGCE
jgi:hypothetical protein